MVSKSRHGDGSIKAKTPAGFNRLIPGWMLEVEAMCYGLSEEARISTEAILSLIELLERSIEGLRFVSDSGCGISGRNEQMRGGIEEGGDGDRC